MLGRIDVRRDHRARPIDMTCDRFADRTAPRERRARPPAARPTEAGLAECSRRVWCGALPYASTASRPGPGDRLASRSCGERPRRPAVRRPAFPGDLSHCAPLTRSPRVEKARPANHPGGATPIACEDTGVPASQPSDANRPMDRPKHARQMALALVLVGVVAFWGGTWMAARHYPLEYDWRYMTISSLLSAERNPVGHLWDRLASRCAAFAGTAGQCCGSTASSYMARRRRASECARCKSGMRAWR